MTVSGVLIPPDDSSLVAMLTAAGLPTGDLAEPGQCFFAFTDGSAAPAGCGGFLVAGDHALMRSIAVNRERRSERQGAAILEHLAAAARESGASHAWLLTTDKAGFFARYGFNEVARSEVPPAIARTPQFLGLCPASAAFMHKSLQKAHPMSAFERYLTLWVALCIVAGIALGHFFAPVFQRVGATEIANVNLPVAVLIWLMIVPMLMKVDFTALSGVREHWRGIGVTLFINWAVKPFTMAALAAFFIGHVFRSYLPGGQIDSYIAGLIILGAAPCTAMVFVWSHLTDGEPNFTLSQVALNDTIMVVAFAPIVGLLLGLSAITVPWQTLTLSVVLYIIVPVIAAQLVRRILLARSEDSFRRALSALQPISLASLLATLVLLFGFQGEQIIAQPLVIAVLAVPILIQVYFNSGLAYILNRWSGERHCIAGPSALIGASNFFELAVAAAISIFGFKSGAALATVVGVLIEVPVMLSIVTIVNRSKGWYEQGAAVSRRSRVPAGDRI